MGSRACQGRRRLGYLGQWLTRAGREDERKVTVDSCETEIRIVTLGKANQAAISLVQGPEQSVNCKFKNSLAELRRHQKDGFRVSRSPIPIPTGINLRSKNGHHSWFRHGCWFDLPERERWDGEHGAWEEPLFTRHDACTEPMVTSSSQQSQAGQSH